MTGEDMNPFKNKFFSFYQDVATRASQESYAKRKQVGAAIILPTGNIAVGWNGMASGLPNQCELADGTTDPRTTHAERNALDKLTREGISPNGSILFVTLSPCLECAKSIAHVGIKAVYYRDFHRQDGLDYLKSLNILALPWEPQNGKPNQVVE